MKHPLFSAFGRLSHSTRIAVVLSACAAVFAGTALIAADVAKMQVASHLTVAHAQDYIARESAASPALKARIASIRQAVIQEKLTFTVGLTDALEKPLASLAGTQAPKELATVSAAHNVKALQLLAIDREARAEYARINPNRLIELKIQCNTGSGSFDWRSLGKVTNVKNQQCGNCWAYASMGSYESSYLIRNGISLDTSEQYIVSCAKYDNGNDAGTCTGGWHAGVYEYLVSTGDINQTPDTGTNGTCTVVPNAPYRAVAWGYVNQPAAPGFEDGIPSRGDMKAALCEHGPLAVAVLATDKFQAYTGGTFKENLSDATLHPVDPNHTSWKYHSINHDVLLIGWNDSKHAWLIKNSWGTNWGETCGMGTEKGYMWIDYDSNNIGLGAAWVQAKNQLYKLPPRYYQLKPNIKPFLEIAR